MGQHLANLGAAGPSIESSSQPSPILVPPFRVRSLPLVLTSSRRRLVQALQCEHEEIIKLSQTVELAFCLDHFP